MTSSSPLDLREFPDLPGPSAAVLIERFGAVDRFLRLAEPHVAEEELAPARALVNRAGARLRLSGEHTVVALAGATGTGKSALFNALTGIELSPVGPLRPTTGDVYACVWGLTGAAGLLDWLGVPADRRFARERVRYSDEHAALHGLVLLDLPDVDSVAVGHQVVSDRLISHVDLVVWVLDPQKYADRLVHEAYLARFGNLAGATAVVLNQIDRLTPEDAARCVADVGRLLAADGLADARVVATSAVTGAGLSHLRDLLADAVRSRMAALTRLGAELDEVVTGLGPLVDRELPVEAAGAVPTRELIDTVAAASGVDAVADTAAAEYGRRTVTVPDLAPAPAAVGLAVRRYVETAAAAVPVAWRDAVHAAVPDEPRDLAARLRTALAAAAPGPARRSRWWTLSAIIVLVGLLAAVIGLGWLVGAGIRLTTEDVPWSPPRWSGVPVPVCLLVAGLVVALVPAILRWRVRRSRSARLRTDTATTLRGAVDDVLRPEVVDPVRHILLSYDEARAALSAAR
ncbi:GTPase family protein [Luedemannella helvata]|uniref:GTPase family protein n=1 Tax=Luedemannella helvata TaxID=349315 RepID=UPI0031E21896